MFFSMMFSDIQHADVNNGKLGINFEINLSFNDF